jgi:hypothetical protein
VEEPKEGHVCEVDTGQPLLLNKLSFFSNAVKGFLPFFKREKKKLFEVQQLKKSDDWKDKMKKELIFDHKMSFRNNVYTGH